MQRSEFFAERLKREAGDDPAKQVRRAFLLAFGRKPTRKELSAAVPLSREHGLPACCPAVYNANEFVPSPGLWEVFQMIISKHKETPKVMMEIVTDPVELAKARELDAKFQRNWEWYQPKAQEIFEQHRGKCICVAGQELFVGDTPKAALDAARAAHPEDDGLFTRIIPRERMWRIYANRRRMAAL